MNTWNISEAKQRFTQVVISSEEAPQIICNRGKPVSAVLHIDLFNELMALREKQRKPTIMEMMGLIGDMSQHPEGLLVGVGTHGRRLTGRARRKARSGLSFFRT